MFIKVTKCLPEVTWQMARILDADAQTGREQLLLESALAVADSEPVADKH